MAGIRGRGVVDEDVDAFVQEADEDAVDNDDWDTLGGASMAASRGPPVDIYRRYDPLMLSRLFAALIPAARVDLFVSFLSFIEVQM